MSHEQLHLCYEAPEEGKYTQFIGGCLACCYTSLISGCIRNEDSGVDSLTHWLRAACSAPVCPEGAPVCFSARLEITNHHQAPDCPTTKRPHQKSRPSTDRTHTNNHGTHLVHLNVVPCLIGCEIWCSVRPLRLTGRINLTILIPSHSSLIFEFKVSKYFIQVYVRFSLN